MLVSQGRSADIAGKGSLPDIVVSTQRGSTAGDAKPLAELSSSDLEAYGADSLSDLVDALRPLTRSSRGDQPAVILINGRLAGQTEFENLPGEAVERVEILPEGVALRYGFSASQRVLNFVLRKHYSSVPLRATDSVDTEAGGQGHSADLSVVQLSDETRATLLTSYKSSAWLRDNMRGIELPNASYYTLVPKTIDTKVAATISRPFLGVTSSFEASYNSQSFRSLQGPATEVGQLSYTIEPLETRYAVRTSRVAMQLTGLFNDFVWGATAYYMRVASNSSSDLGIDNVEGWLVDLGESRFDIGNLQFSVSGPIAYLPAGPIRGNLQLSYQYQGFASRDAQPGVLPVENDIRRTVRSINFNASVPISNPDQAILPTVGELSCNFTGALDAVSYFGKLYSGAAGLNWHPLDKLHLDVSYMEHRTAPTMQQLQAPTIYIRNVETYDYVTQQTVYPTEVTGGNESLAATDARQVAFGITYGPFAGKSEFLAHLEEIRIHNAIGKLPPVDTSIESAFPNRFLRDANGNLIEIDDRSINLDRQRVEDVKWGFNIWVPIGQPQDINSRLSFSMFDTWYLRDETLIRPGIAPLNLLDGAPADVTGGEPRHKVDIQALYYRSGMGVLLAEAWRSPTIVNSGNSKAPDSIYFSSLATTDLRVFLDLGRLPRVQSASWANDVRVSIAVTNLLNRSQLVRDSAGATPIAFEPGNADPHGRVLALTVRKTF
jgi:hypothetical protein